MTFNDFNSLATWKEISGKEMSPTKAARYYPSNEVSSYARMLLNEEPARISKALAQIFFLALTQEGDGTVQLEEAIPEEKKFLCREWGASFIKEPVVGYRIARRDLILHGKELIDGLAKRRDFPAILEDALYHRLNYDLFLSLKQESGLFKAIVKIIPPEFDLSPDVLRETEKIIRSYHKDPSPKEKIDWQKSTGISGNAAKKIQDRIADASRPNANVLSTVFLGNGTKAQEEIPTCKTDHKGNRVISFIPLDKAVRPPPAPQNSPRTEPPARDRRG